MSTPLATVTPRLLARKGSATVLMKGAALALQAAHFSVVARSVSVAAFSSYAAATALLVIVGTVAEFGLIQTGVVAMSEGYRPEEVTTANLRATGVTMLLSSLIVAGATTLLLRGGAQLALVMLMPGFLVARADTPFLSWHIFHLNTTRVAGADIASRAVLFLTALPLAVIHSPSMKLTFAILGAGLLACELTSLAAVVPGVRLARRQSGFPVSLLLRRSLPIGLTNTSSLIHSRSDQVLLDAIGQPVAPYAIAARINEAILALVNSAGLVSLGTTARSSNEERPSTVRRFVAVAAVVGFVASVTTFALAPLLVRVVGGPTYVGSEVLVRLLAPALMASVMNLPLAQAVVLAGRASLLFTVSAFGVTLNVLLTLAIVAVIGVRGAAVATSISEMLGLGLSAIIAWRIMNGGVPWVTIISTAGLSTVAFAAMWVLPAALAAITVGASLVAVCVIAHNDSSRLSGMGKSDVRSSSPDRSQ